MKYFVTLTVECGPGSVFNATNDDAVIASVQRQFNDISKHKGTVREFCIHHINNNEIMPIFSRNFALGMVTHIADPDGQTLGYNLGLPLTIRQSLKNQTEVSQDSDWSSESEESENDGVKRALEVIRRFLDNHLGINDEPPSCLCRFAYIGTG